MLAKVAKEDKQKVEILTELKSRLLNHEPPPSLAQLRSLATTLGIKDHIPNRREQAVNHIIRHLSAKSVEEISTALHTELPGQRDLGIEYDRWVELILGSRSKTSEQTRKKKSDGTP